MPELVEVELRDAVVVFGGDIQFGEHNFDLSLASGSCLKFQPGAGWLLIHKTND